MKTYKLTDPPEFTYGDDGEYRAPDCRGCEGCAVKDKYQRVEQEHGGLGACKRLRNMEADHE